MEPIKALQIYITWCAATCLRSAGSQHRSPCLLSNLDLDIHFGAKWRLGTTWGSSSGGMREPHTAVRHLQKLRLRGAVLEGPFWTFIIRLETEKEGRKEGDLRPTSTTHRLFPFEYWILFKRGVGFRLGKCWHKVSRSDVLSKTDGSRKKAAASYD